MLDDRTIIVTGAGGALGSAVCARAQQLGARTIGLDVVFDDPGADRYRVDLTDLAAVEACLEQVGDFDALFNIAGGFAMGTAAWADDEADWQRMFTLNVLTVRNMVKAAVPRLLARGGGSIVNVGAYGARQGLGEMGAYCASKSVVMRLTETLAEELRDKGINVNAVLPTVIDTPTNRAAMPQADPAAWVHPDDLADVICFLGSSGAGAVHGALVPVRGLS